MAGKLVTHQQRRQPLLRHGRPGSTRWRRRRLVILTPGGPAGSFVAAELLQLGDLQEASKHAELAEDLIRWVEDEKRFEEYMQVSVGQAGPVYKARADNPYWKSDPNFEAHAPEHPARACRSGYPGPITPAAVEVQAQYIL